MYSVVASAIYIVVMKLLHVSLALVRYNILTEL